MNNAQKRAELEQLGWHQRWKRALWQPPGHTSEYWKHPAKVELMTLDEAWHCIHPVANKEWGQWSLHFERGELQCTVRNVIYDERFIYRVQLDHISNHQEILAALLKVTYQPWAVEESNAFVVGQLLVAITEILDLAPDEGIWDPKAKLEDYKLTYAADMAAQELAQEDEAHPFHERIKSRMSKPNAQNFPRSKP